MAIPSSSSKIESFSTTRPPLFMGIDYPYWKTKMTWFIQSTSLDLWDVIEDGPHIPSKLENGVMVPKLKHEWDELDRKKVQLNAKAVFILHCAIDRNEFNHIWHYKSAKEIWKLLEVTYEGNDEVKESKINVLMHDYKLFSIKEFESIVEMFSRFLVIVNELETLEKTYTEVQELYDVYMGQPTELHLQTAKRVLRYLRGTTNLGIFYKKGGNDKLVAFTDSDYADDLEDRKSTSGYVFMLSSGAVSWSSRKQPVVSLSTTEVEFIAATSCACQAIWMRRILEKLSHTQGNCTTMFCDNSSTIKLSKNPMMHGRSKHIDVHFHFLRDLTKEGVVELVHCGTQDQIADVMTKPLKLDMFLKLRELMGVREVPDVN
ncbi:Retrovirus-related Pol polyprotein from transposon RE1 [Vitis vinifera]|uniref:Retrovirus-related Pol polyprotein from transposon RE1 n=1 Tax=Vitis vinifera TaxID=29760 RepID=A0A438FRD3_VITVI|nr:Retrovirus-related Pol polyprotein from transposon RE1 [Vitis vinifera]